MAENQTIQISGAPVITNLSGTFYLSNPTQVGYNRIWRNQGPSVIYYQPPDQNNPSIISGWKLADIITGTIYFSEDHSDETSTAENPWDVVSWASTAYADHTQVLRVLRSTEPQWTHRDPVVSGPEPNYVVAPDSTFHVTKDYYYHNEDTTSPCYTGSNYYRVKQIVLGNKIDPGVFYEYDGMNFVLTTDKFFVSHDNGSKIYYTKVDGTYIPTVYIESTIPKETIEGKVYSNFYIQNGVTVLTEQESIDNLTGTIISGTTHTISEVEEIEIKMHDRYSTPKIEVGQVYRFAFINDFRYLGYLPPSEQDFELTGRYSEDKKGENDSDITRGIFRVENITTYYNLVLSGVDIYQNLYLPLNLTPELFEADRKKWMNDDIWYKLVDPVVETRVLYVPLGIIDGIPDGNVSAYDRYHLIIDIGIFSDPEVLTDIITNVNMLMRAKFGIPSTAQMASYDKVYIPDEYYEWLNKVRKEYSDNFMKEDSSQYYQTLFFDKYNQLHKDYLELKGKVDVYEKLLREVNENG